jgi:ligand-binding sensor domain-containing protein
MKQLSCLVLILFFNISFGQKDKTDPYFLETRDTISTRGPACITRHILEDKKGNIWLATWQGIIKYDGKVFTNYTLKDKLIHFHVYSLMEDKSGNIWIGTVRGGAYKYDGKSFTHFTYDNGLPDDLIDCMMEDKTGNIWFGTDGGVSKFDTSATRTIKPKTSLVTFADVSPYKKGFTNYNVNNGLCGDRVNSMMQDKSGKIWIATRTGVSVYDNKTFNHFMLSENKPFTNVRCVKEDKNGKIWIGGMEGLYCYDPSKTGEAALTKLMPNFIGYINEDKAGNLWLSAGEDKGMALYKYDGKSLTKIIEKKDNGDSQVFESVEDKKGNIWFGTMRGPCLYDGKTFTYFTYIKK